MTDQKCIRCGGTDGPMLGALCENCRTPLCEGCSGGDPLGGGFCEECSDFMDVCAIAALPKVMQWYRSSLPPAVDHLVDTACQAAAVDAYGIAEAMVKERAIRRYG